MLTNISTYETGRFPAIMWYFITSWSYGNMHIVGLIQKRHCFLKSNLIPLSSAGASDLNCLAHWASFKSSFWRRFSSLSTIDFEVFKDAHFLWIFIKQSLSSSWCSPSPLRLLANRILAICVLVTLAWKSSPVDLHWPTLPSVHSILHYLKSTKNHQFWMECLLLCNLVFFLPKLTKRSPITMWFGPQIVSVTSEMDLASQKTYNLIFYSSKSTH